MDRVLVHAVRRERPDFKERRAGIEEPHYALAGQQLAAGEMALPRLGRSALGHRGAALLQFGGDGAPRFAVRLGGDGLQINGGRKNGH
jgi:hypothetical protein